MMTARQWSRMRAQDTALLINSTKAGQNLLRGVRRPELGVLRPTKSNPRGVCMVQRGPKMANPLLVLNQTERLIANQMRQANGIRVNKHSISQTARWVPLQDVVRHNQAKAACE